MRENNEENHDLGLIQSNQSARLENLPIDAFSIESLVHDYTEALLKGSLSLGFSIEESRDLLQSVWLTFMEVGKNFEGRSHIRTFLFGILYNKAKEKRRFDQKLVPEEDIEDIANNYFDEKGRWLKPPDSPEKFLQASQTMKLIDECIDSLPLNHRMAFCMAEVEECSSKEICSVMNLTTNHLGVILFRAKSRLRDCIEQKARGRENL